MGWAPGSFTAAVLKITNLAEVNKGIDQFIKDVEATSLSAYRGLCNYAFAYIVEEMPQYTGESVSNTRMSSGTPEYSIDSGIKSARSKKGKRFKRLPVFQAQGFTGINSSGASPVGQGGNPAAMKIARASLRAGNRKIRLNQAVYITNATEWYSDMNIHALESPPAGFLRKENKTALGHGEMFKRAASYILDNFTVIGQHNIKRLMVVPA